MLQYKTNIVNMKFRYMLQDSTMLNLLLCTIVQNSAQTLLISSTVSETTTHDTTTRSVLLPYCWSVVSTVAWHFYEPVIIPFTMCGIWCQCYSGCCLTSSWFGFSSCAVQYAIVSHFIWKYQIFVVVAFFWALGSHW